MAERLWDDTSRNGEMSAANMIETEERDCADLKRVNLIVAKRQCTSRSGDASDRRDHDCMWSTVSKELALHEE